MKKLKNKLVPGRISIYESDACKKNEYLGEITAVTSVCAVYPQLHFFIDKSTMMKLDGTTFSVLGYGKRSKASKDAPDSEASLFVMPEEHHSVPGYDTLIRFLIPLFDAFGLYGRPKRLKADRMDPESLLFGLPTLPCVYYLEVSDLMSSISSTLYLGWDVSQWRAHIKSLLARKLSQGYSGCGSVKELNINLLGQVSSPGTPRVMSLLTGRFPASLSSVSANGESKSTGRDKGSLGAGPTGNSKPYATSGLKSDPISAGRQQVAPATASNAQHPAKSVQIRYAGPNNAAYNGNVHYPVSGDSSSHAGNSSGSSGSSAGTTTTSARLAGDGLFAGAAAGAAMQNKNPNSMRRNDLAVIYQSYTKLQAPTDILDDRNRMLNGSVEEIDETKLPSLMRKKLLRHGPYPTHDKFNGESDDDEDKSEESEEDLGENAHKLPAKIGNDYTGRNGSDDSRLGASSTGKALAQYLTVDKYEERNASYSSVSSPNTQYQELNKQLKKNFAASSAHDLNLNNSDVEDSDQRTSPPTLHGEQTRGAGSQPQISTGYIPQQQQTPSLGGGYGSSSEKYNMRSAYTQPRPQDQKTGIPLSVDDPLNRPGRDQFASMPNVAAERTQGSMQSLQNQFSNTSVDARGHESLQMPQYGRSADSHPVPMPNPQNKQYPPPGPNAQYQPHRPAAIRAIHRAIHRATMATKKATRALPRDIWDIRDIRDTWDTHRAQQICNPGLMAVQRLLDTARTQK
ncbi:hypothetical protein METBISCDRAFT_28207 [Metschnikowia bicuspidata]|uniref:Skg3/CAF120-like PH-like domain-containing protein n=1 Tax=Metschnikowia bicuspidata TaxID=27322 RepID=A0A4P9ZAX4_9ASCO|nr:hypothetical protein METBISCDRAFT_28207 [Metschnikowia bicuspidata]